MAVKFKDYFSESSAEYNKFRPNYPEELFSYLSSISEHHLKAWDCATGNGQSALFLSEYFSEVIATDASKAQIENAVQKKGIIYQVATAEKTKIETNSVDLVTVAQAFHWFNIEDFAKEAKRVSNNNGIIAVWTYNLLSINNEIDKIINHLYSSTLGGFWATERKLVENGYKDIELPFEELETPSFQMSAKWSLSQLIGYLCTWSAVKKYQQKLGVNPIEEVHLKLLEAWGQPDTLLPVKWPLSIRVWKNTN